MRSGVVGLNERCDVEMVAENKNTVNVGEDRISFMWVYNDSE